MNYRIIGRAMERSTRQRQAIRRVLEDYARPLALQQLLEAAQQYVPNLGVATVYRTLKQLMADGTVTQVDVAGDQPHYEITQISHHHHFHCRQCKSVFEIHTCPEDLKRLHGLTAPGFQVQDRHVMLYGLCSACSTASMPGRPARRSVAQRGANHRVAPG